MDFADVKNIVIPEGKNISRVKYIVGHDQAIHDGEGKALLWRKPNEFPYVIGAYSYKNSAGNTIEYFSPAYIERYGEPVNIKATFLPTYNAEVNTKAHLMATSSLVGTLLNGYFCTSETDCQNLHIPSKRNKLGQIYYVYWHSLDSQKHKILVYASKGQSAMTVLTPYPKHIDGAPTYLKYQYASPITLGSGFPIPYGEFFTPDLCRVLDTTTPLVTIRHESGAMYAGYSYWSWTNKITAVREDYSDLIEKYDIATSGAYPKSEYPYLDGVTELGFDTVRIYGSAGSETCFGFYVFFRIAR